MSTQPPLALLAAFKQILAEWKWLYGPLPTVRTPSVMPRITTTQLSASAQLLEEALQQGVTPTPPGPPDPADPTVDSITVSPSSVPALAVGDHVQLLPTAKNAAGVTLTGVSFTYDVADDSLATVTPQGVVTATAVGSTIVLVQSGTKSVAVSLVTVAPPVSTTPASIAIAPTSATLTVGGADVPFTATVRNASSVVLAGAPVTYTSSDPTKVTVGLTSGIAHAVAAGTATITATSSDPTITASATITVNADTTPAGVNVSGPLSLTVGGATGQITAHAVNAAGATLSTAIVYTTSNAAIATVNSSTGVVTAVAAGSCSIHCTASPANTDVSVTVAASATTPAAVAVNPTSGSISVNGPDLQLTATVTNGSSQVISGAAITWSSSNAAIATVSSTGLVHAVAAGSATITARTSNALTATSAITVQADVTPATVTVSPSTLSGIAGGAPQQLSASAKNLAGTLVAATITWSSSAPSVATVSSTGAVNFIAAGTATITAATTNGKTGTAGVTVAASNPNPPPTGYSIASPHYSHKDEQWTDFGYHYRNLSDPAVLAEINVKAGRMDQIMGGDGKSRWSANAGMSYGPYALIWKPLIPGLNGGTGASQGSAWAGSSTDPASDMKTYADAHGFDVETMLLHYRDGQIKFETAKNITAITAGTPAVLTIPAHGYASGQRVATTNMSQAASGLVSKVYNTGMIVIDANTISVPDTATASVTTGSMGQISNAVGDGSKTFTNRKIVRVGTFGVRWMMNPAEPHQGAYHGQRLAPSFSGADFVFIDESDSSQFGTSWIDSLEYSMAGLTSPQQTALVQTHYNDINTVQAGIRAANGNKWMQANTASYYTALDRQMAKGAGGAQHEQSPNLTNGVDSYGQYLTFALQCLSDGSKIVMVDPYSYDDIIWQNAGTNTIPNADPVTGAQLHGSLTGMTIGGYSSVVMRFKTAYYALYLMARPAANGQFYYDDNTAQWTEPQTPKFNKVSEALLGLPTGSRVSTTVATTDTGPVALSDRIASRSFQNGWVVLRLANDRIAGHYGDTPVTTVTLPTDATYYRVHDDGSIDATPSTTVQLRRIEAAIFVKAPGGGTPPPDTTTASVTVSPANATVPVSSTTTLTSTSRNAAGTVLTGKTPVWSSSAPSIASVDSASGVVTGVAAGTATITSTEGGHTGTATITVQVTNAVAGFPNATAGGTIAGCRDFSSKAANTTDTGTGTDTGSGKAGGSQGWGADTEFGNAQFTIGTDAAAPNTPPSVGIFTFPSGSVGDTPVGFGYASAPSGSWRRMYYGIDLLIGTGMPGVQLQIARFLFGSRTLGLWLINTGANFTPKIYGEGITDATLHGTYFPQNVDATKSLTKGSWNRIEVEILTNTKGLSDGTVNLWLGPTLLSAITGLQVDSSATVQNLFSQHQTRPRANFGSALGSNVPLSIDHVYALVKSA